MRNVLDLPGVDESAAVTGGETQLTDKVEHNSLGAGIVASDGNLRKKNGFRFLTGSVSA